MEKEEINNVEIVNPASLNCVDLLFEHRLRNKTISKENMAWLKENGYLENPPNNPQKE